jgi:hypothetical protein
MSGTAKRRCEEEISGNMEGRWVENRKHKMKYQIN